MNEIKRGGIQEYSARTVSHYITQSFTTHRRILVPWHIDKYRNEFCTGSEL